jgi:hypothetical protein
VFEDSSDKVAVDVGSVAPPLESLAVVGVILRRVTDALGVVAEAFRWR